MVRYITFTLLFTLSFSFSKGQGISIQETNEKINGENHNTLTVVVKGVPVDDVEKEVRKEFRSMGRTRNRKDPLFVDDAEHDDMGDNPFDFYADCREEGDNSTYLVVGVNLGGAYLNSSEHPDRFEAMKQLIFDFVYNLRSEKIQERIEEQEAKLDDLTDELEDIQSEKEDRKETIEDKKEVIEEAKKAIEEAKKDIEDLKEKKSEQQTKVEEQKKKIEKLKEKKNNIK